MDLLNSTIKSAIAGFNHIDQMRLLTPQQADILIIGATGVLVLIVFRMWLVGLQGKLRIVLAGASVPFFLAALLHVPGAFRGTPDDRCGEYGGGKLTYELVDMIRAPRRSAEVYGDTWLILIVRAPDRWGDEIHQCRLDPKDERVGKLVEAIKSFRFTAGEGTNGRGLIHFTFGSKAEFPNVRFAPTAPQLKKPGPPEVLPHQQRST